MVAAMDINITKVERSKLKDINLENIPFGKYFTDHMLEADYENGEWKMLKSSLINLIIGSFYCCNALWPVNI